MIVIDAPRFIPYNPNHVINNNNQQPVRSYDDRGERDRIAIFWILCIALLTVLFTGVIWAMLHEEVPVSLQVNKFETTSMTISNEFMSASLRLNLSVGAVGEKITFDSPFLVSLKYGHKVLTSTKLQPFSLVKSGLKTFAPLEMSIRIEDHAMVYSMNKQLTRIGALEFSLTARGHIFEGDYCEGEGCGGHPIDITCKGIKVRFLSGYDSINGSFIAQPPSCKPSVSKYLS